MLSGQVDLYNELDPPSFDLDYLTNNTRSVVQSLRNVDSDAVWVMQGWMFTQDKRWNKEAIKALLDGAKIDEMVRPLYGSGIDNVQLVLDLAAEAQPIWDKTESYSDHEWLWCHVGPGVSDWHVSQLTSTAVDELWTGTGVLRRANALRQ